MDRCFESRSFDCWSNDKRGFSPAGRYDLDSRRRTAAGSTRRNDGRRGTGGTGGMRRVWHGRNRPFRESNGRMGALPEQPRLLETGNLRHQVVVLGAYAGLGNGWMDVWLALFDMIPRGASTPAPQARVEKHATFPEQWLSSPPSLRSELRRADIACRPAVQS